MVKQIDDQLLDAVETELNNFEQNAPFDKTVQGRILASLGGGLYSVSINNITYKVSSVDKNAMYAVGDIVKVIIQQNDYNKLYIPVQSGSIQVPTAEVVQANLEEHENNTDIHTNISEKAIWNAKLDSNSDGSNLTNTFSAATSRTNLTTGEKISISLGKIVKWFSDLKAVAFSGSYNDLSSKPSIPSALSDLSDDASHRIVTDTEKSTWNGKQNALSGDVTSHYHSYDRNRANHTGTQTSSTISDFSSAVSGNSDVSANTNARHTHSNKTVLDNTTASYTTDEKSKLSGIQDGANNYILPVASDSILGGIKVGANLSVATDGTLNANDNPSSFIIREERFIATAGQTVFTLTKGTYEPNANRIFWYWNRVKQNSDVLSETSSTTVTLPENIISAGDEILFDYIEVLNADPLPIHGSEHLSDGIDPIPNATGSKNGLMSPTDKVKLDGIDTSADVNKIETIQQNGTALPISNKTVNITVPTKVSDITNDTGFITSSSSITGNAATATKLSTERTINLTGDVTGSTSFDGSENTSITTTVDGGTSDYARQLISYTFYRNATTPIWAKVATVSIPYSVWFEYHAMVFVKGRHNSNYNQNGILAIDAVGNGTNGVVASATAKFINASEGLDVSNFYIEKIDATSTTAGCVNLWVRINTNGYASWDIRVLTNSGWTFASTITSASTLPTTDYTGSIAYIENKSSKLVTPRTINGVLFDGTSNITIEDSTKAPLSSPTLTGTPTAPTATTGTNTTQIATTAFVQNSLSSVGAGDMLKSVYDTNSNGIVDNSEALNGRNETSFAYSDIKEGVDFNTIFQSGMYRVSGSNANAPANAAWGQLIVAHGGGDTVLQIVSDYQSGSIYWRSGNTFNNGSGAWGRWKEFMDRENVQISSTQPTGQKSGDLWFQII